MPIARLLITRLVVAFITLVSLGATNSADAAKHEPIKVLLIAGGCCHDYDKQSSVLKKGIEARIHAEVTIIYNPEKATTTRFEHYKKDDWADGYDVILHDECSAGVTDKAYVDRILAAHKQGVPAVNLHCAMHCYRWGNYRQPVEDGADNAGWYEFVGIQSSGHGPKAPIDVTYVVDAVHPIAKGLDNWSTTIDELYNNLKLFEEMKPIAMGRQLQPPSKKALKADPDAPAKEETAILAWTNLYGPNKAKVFSLTLGHTDDVVENPNYLDLVARGLLWTTDKLNDDGTPKVGYGK